MRSSKKYIRKEKQENWFMLITKIRKQHSKKTTRKIRKICKFRKGF